MKTILKKVLQKATFEIFPTEKIKEEIKIFPKNTHIAVTCTSKKGIDFTLDAAIALREKDLDAYPHIIAKQILDDKDLQRIKIKLEKNNIDEVFVAAGDTGVEGSKFYSAMDILHALAKIGIPFKNIAITGYPEGHPKIKDKRLLEALQDKQEFITRNKLEGRIITQMCFDADLIVRWAIAMKEKGITLPIMVGIAGPCNLLKLVEFAIKCGAGESAKFLTSKKTLGKNILAHLSLQYTPEQLIREIIDHPLFDQTNIIGFHFYTFNNITDMVKWNEKFVKTVEGKEQ